MLRGALLLFRKVSADTTRCSKELDLTGQAACVREPTQAWATGTLSHLSVPGWSPHLPALSPGLLWRGPASVTAAEAQEGGRPGGSRGRRDARAGAYRGCSGLGSAQPATAGSGGQFSGRQEPPLQLLGLLRGDKGVQSPQPRWKPNGLLRGSWGHAEFRWDHGYLDVCAMDMHHLRG